MPFGTGARLVDSRFAEFAERDAGLLEASPHYAALRTRILADGTPSRGGRRLDLGHGVFAELQAVQDVQPIGFGTDGLPATRYRIIHARTEDATRPLAWDTCEHYVLSYGAQDDRASLERVVNAVEFAPARLENDVLSLFDSATGMSVRVHPRAVGRMQEARFTPGGRPLDVLRYAGTRATYTSSSGGVDFTKQPGGIRAATPYLKRLSFLSPPAARQMIELLVDGHLEGGELDSDLLEASLSLEAFEEPVVCALCSVSFRPSRTSAERAGVGYSWRICSDCQMSRNREAHSVAARIATDPLEDLVLLTALLGQVPRQDWPNHLESVATFELYLQLRWLPIRTRGWYEGTFGSWLHALTAAGVVSEGTHQSGIGVRTLAEDGHVCASLGEKTIDDWLHRHHVAHTREPRYPEGMFRADWLVDGVFVEYWGLAGNPTYDAKAATKRAIADRAGIKIVDIYPRDLATWGTSQRRIAEWIGFDT